jgi:type II secretory pathway pseudopilin PulG
MGFIGVIVFFGVMALIVFIRVKVATNANRDRAARERAAAAALLASQPAQQVPQAQPAQPVVIQVPPPVERPKRIYGPDDPPPPPPA